MTIYLTPFDDTTKQATAASSDSGFSTLAEAVEMLGPDWLTCSSRAVVYPCVMLSDFVVRAEP